MLIVTFGYDCSLTVQIILAPILLDLILNEDLITLLWRGQLTTFWLQLSQERTNRALIASLPSRLDAIDYGSYRF